MDGTLDRMALTAVMYTGGIVIGALALAAIAGLIRSSRRRVNRARGAERPEWAPGIWMCAHCRSSNHPTARVCTSCRQSRADLAREPVEARPDWIPEAIVVPSGSIPALVHEPAAHGDPEAAHWLVKVNGRIVGTAQRRAGALELLRRIEDSDLVLLDVRGDGAAMYRLTDAVARFEAPRFPLDVPCKERTG